MTPEEFFMQADMEGLAYYLTSYVSQLTTITDPYLRDLAIDARRTLNMIANYRDVNDIDYF